MKLADLRRHPEFLSCMAVILSFVVIVAGAAWLGLHKRQQWRVFAEQHNCQKVGKIEGDLVTSGNSPTMAVLA